MKKLDKLLLISFVGPLFVTFFVALFVFDMQFFYVYMDELIGKGLGPLLVTKLLALMSATMVSAALPLGVLLASIMTFGSLGENYELVAIKSSGISLLRFMRPIMVLMIIISLGAFLFNNYVIPVANLKAFSLLYDLRHSKPALNIKAGQFNNDIDQFSIKVGSKDADGQGIRNIIIYDQTSGIGNDNIVLAGSGTMRPDASNRGLVFHLQDGWRYQEGLNNKRSGLQHDEQIRMHFQRWDKMIDLTSMGLTRTNEELFKNGYQMQDVIQLSSSIDSIRKNRQREIDHGEWYFKPYLTGYVKTDVGDSVRKKMDSPAMAASDSLFKTNFLSRIPDSMKSIVAGNAASQVRNIKSALDGTAGSYAIYSKNMDKHYVELHKRFTLSFACILMFLIGAPLGSIIRKGGLGLPIVVAIVFFLIYYLLSSMGEKGALSGDFSPLVGVWMSTAMLLPFAVVLIVAARNDSPVFSPDWYLRRWHGIRNTIGKKTKPGPIAQKTTAQL